MTDRHPKAPRVPAHPLIDLQSDEVAYAGRFAMQIVKFRYRKFDGAWSRTKTWELWRRGDGVMSLPYDPWTDRVALIEQFRLPALAAGLDPVMLECPAGLLEAHEDPAEATSRETAEETGLVPDRYLSLGRFMLMQGGCDEISHPAIARVRLPDLGRLPDAGLETEDESTRVIVVQAEEAFAMVADNRILNMPAAFCIQALQLRRPVLRAEWTRP
ncbi:NUDIX domain-containing protein [Humitalea sp. 24SJ18S-53]|uniref:NUDIX domain-containing protein n=1 Tax=Humitalea sp. 24SJ18S-53 TaxID=3422307 RepID=UPI003D67DF1C